MGVQSCPRDLPGFQQENVLIAPTKYSAGLPSGKHAEPQMAEFPPQSSCQHDRTSTGKSFLSSRAALGVKPAEISIFFCCQEHLQAARKGLKSQVCRTQNKNWSHNLLCCSKRGLSGATAREELETWSYPCSQNTAASSPGMAPACTAILWLPCNPSARPCHQPHLVRCQLCLSLPC